MGLLPLAAAARLGAAGLVGAALGGPALRAARRALGALRGRAGGPVPGTAPALGIGGTPVLDLSYLSRAPGKVQILAKCEFANPTGSIKDRMVEYVLRKAVASGALKPGGTIVSATSGNTGASVAMLAARAGHPYRVVTNSKCSTEKVNIMRAFGGEVVVGPSGIPADHPEHYQNIAIRMCEEDPSCYDLDQYGNQLNPETYYATLGPEIWADTGGRVTHFVAGGSTGGTMSGTARYLKEQNPAVRAVMPDPVGSVFFPFWKQKVPEAELEAGSYQVEGVGKDSIPTTMHFDVVDDMLQVRDTTAVDVCLEVGRQSGVLIGGSSGLNVAGAVELSGQIGEGVIVTVLPDSGFKYLSKIYDPAWREAKIKA